MDEATVDKITEAVAKILAMKPGSEREENLNKLIGLLDKERVSIGRMYIHAISTAVSYMTEAQELRAEVQRLQSEAAVRMSA